MIDLVVLLTLALLFMAALSLLFAGFIWMPWLIGLVLIGLLVALRRVTTMTDRQVALEILSESDTPTEPPPTAAQTPSQATSSEPVMLYRGAKYKVEHSSASHAPSVLTGKYRGSPWQRNQ